MDEQKRRRGDRRDGVWLRDLDPLHVFTPYLMPNRADNEAFIEETIDLTAVNAYLEEKNKEDPEFKYTFFHIILAALVKTVTLRPRMNRFIAGNRMYQRTELTGAFVIKKQFSDKATESLLFLHFGEEDPSLRCTARSKARCWPTATRRRWTTPPRTWICWDGCPGPSSAL